MPPLIRAIQARAAVSIGRPTVRGRGVVGAAQEFLAPLDLRRFGVSDKEVFRDEPKEATKRLMAALPEKAWSWGIARRCLNIFLRDAFYTCHLGDEYDLTPAECSYEVPLEADAILLLPSPCGGGNTKHPRGSPSGV